MINQKKVELMTGIAMYEHTRKISQKQNKDFDRKYKFMIALRSIPVGLAIGLLAACFVFAAKYSVFLSIYRFMGRPLFILIAVCAILIVTAAYTLISVLIITRKYENMRGSYVKYRLYKRELSKLNNEEE